MLRYTHIYLFKNPKNKKVIRGIYGWSSDSGKHQKYIGESSNNVSGRLNRHIKDGKLTQNNKIWVRLMPRSSNKTIARVEQKYIKMYKPTLNKSCGSEVLKHD